MQPQNVAIHLQHAATDCGRSAERCMNQKEEAPADLPGRGAVYLSSRFIVRKRRPDANPGYRSNGLSGLLGGSTVAEALTETLYPTTGVQHLLLAGIEGMAG